MASHLSTLNSVSPANLLAAPGHLLPAQLTMGITNVFAQTVGPALPSISVLAAPPVNHFHGVPLPIPGNANIRRMASVVYNLHGVPRQYPVNHFMSTEKTRVMFHPSVAPESVFQTIGMPNSSIHLKHEDLPAYYSRFVAAGLHFTVTLPAYTYRHPAHLLMYRESTPISLPPLQMVAPMRNSPGPRYGDLMGPIDSLGTEAFISVPIQRLLHPCFPRRVLAPLPWLCTVDTNNGTLHVGRIDSDAHLNECRAFNCSCRPPKSAICCCRPTVSNRTRPLHFGHTHPFRVQARPDIPPIVKHTGTPRVAASGAPFHANMSLKLDGVDPSHSHFPESVHVTFNQSYFAVFGSSGQLPSIRRPRSTSSSSNASAGPASNRPRLSASQLDGHEADHTVPGPSFIFHSAETDAPTALPSVAQVEPVTAMEHVSNVSLTAPDFPLQLDEDIATTEDILHYILKIHGDDDKDGFVPPSRISIYRTEGVSLNSFLHSYREIRLGRLAISRGPEQSVYQELTGHILPSMHMFWEQRGTWYIPVFCKLDVTMSERLSTFRAFGTILAIQMIADGCLTPPHMLTAMDPELGTKLQIWFDWLINEMGDVLSQTGLVPETRTPAVHDALTKAFVAQTFFGHLMPWKLEEFMAMREGFNLRLSKRSHVAFIETFATAFPGQDDHTAWLVLGLYNRHLTSPTEVFEHCTHIIQSLDIV
ncbi:hypothetical protein EW146_g9740 [Bondarzewia mesenterica]|uniref:Uncharacterized protein n=1 Tax=Bondarzewia mesenterica TaxID=1095465 RepID=A0A4S4L3R3_9AGAM|nr:hypothetical protein EW146_g9740 [Bondarzewia mesenterica]